MIKHVARWNDTDYCIVGHSNTIIDNSSEVVKSSLVIDFNDLDISELPVLYQEIQVVKIDESLTETLQGRYYCTDVKYPEFTKGANTNFLVTLTVANPIILATKRTREIEINAENLNTVIVDILEPLIDDGFTIEENTLLDNEISKIYLNSSIETILNELAKENKFMWYIDKNKGIHLLDLDEVNTKAPIKTVNSYSSDYFTSIKPKRSATDYANKLWFNDLNLITEREILTNGTELKNGQYYAFNYPISISENVAFRTPNIIGGYLFDLITDVDEYSIVVDKTLKTITYSSEIGFSGEDDDDSSKKVLLVRATSEQTKVTGFVWNGTTTETMDQVATSISSLFPTRYEVYDPNEINENSDRVNTTGTIEKTIYMNGVYLNNIEALYYAKSLFAENNTQNNEITISFKDYFRDSDFTALVDNLQLSEIIEVNLPIVSGRFIITNRSYIFNNVTLECKLKAKKLNINESFLDIYRTQIKQYTTDDLLNKSTTLYNQDENTVIAHEVIVNGEVVNDD